MSNSLPARLAGFVTRLLAAILIVLGAGFIAGLMFFHPPLGRWLAMPVAVGFAAAGVVAAGLVLLKRRAGWLVALLVAVPGVILWTSLAPRQDRDWSPSVARLPTGEIAGDRLTLRNVRNFTWNLDDTVAAARWETRAYDLAKLANVDLVMNYWMGPDIAHTQLSFGFEDGRRLIWSIEVRTLKGQSFDAFSGLFRSNELVFIAGDERDLVRRRTHVTREDVRIYRLRIPAALGRRLLVGYVEDANMLAERPKFYNTLVSNCTTMIVRLTREVGVAVPADWRFLANGHLPSWLHERGLLAPGFSLDELTRRGSISARALTLPDDERFPAAIRAGVPGVD
jgi:hypothetical protein